MSRIGANKNFFSMSHLLQIKKKIEKQQRLRREMSCIRYRKWQEGAIKISHYYMSNILLWLTSLTNNYKELTDIAIKEIEKNVI